MKKSIYTYFLPAMLGCLIILAMSMPSATHAGGRSFTAMSDTQVTAKGYKLIDSVLMAPIEKEYGLKIADFNLAIRCPSGLTYYVETPAKSGDRWFYGQVGNHKGCAYEKICDFRLSLDEERLEVFYPTDSLYRALN